MRTGTKSVLFGVHAIYLHGFFVWRAYCKLYGFTLHPAILLSCLLHDIGYFGKRHMDDDEGEAHPELGAKIVGALCDSWHYDGRLHSRWHDFCLLHSRFYAKRLGRPMSRLCVADKYSFVLYPKWLYLMLGRASGEIKEYLTAYQDQTSKYSDQGGGALQTQSAWFDHVKAYFIDWCEKNKNIA